MAFCGTCLASASDPKDLKRGLDGVAECRKCRTEPAVEIQGPRLRAEQLCNTSAERTKQRSDKDTSASAGRITRPDSLGSLHAGGPASSGDLGPPPEDLAIEVTPTLKPRKPRKRVKPQYQSSHLRPGPGRYHGKREKGWVLVRISVTRDGTYRDHREAAQELVSEPWYDELRFVSTSRGWHVYERPAMPGEES